MTQQHKGRYTFSAGSERRLRGYTYLIMGVIGLAVGVVAQIPLIVGLGIGAGLYGLWLAMTGRRLIFDPHDQVILDQQRLGDLTLWTRRTPFTQIQAITLRHRAEPAGGVVRHTWMVVFLLQSGKEIQGGTVQMLDRDPQPAPPESLLAYARRISEIIQRPLQDIPT
jgi:hypothetical protein